LDFPALDAPYAPHTPAEQLTTHPAVVAATNRALAACAHLAAALQPPFLALCDAAMGYHLPSCLRLFEAAHVAEALHAGPLHVALLGTRIGVGEKTLAHVLRLLATHHVVREVAPDVFALNRVSSLMDTGRPLEELRRDPISKYAADGGAVAAFVGLCTDELHKSSAYLTEAVFPAWNGNGNALADPTRAPFNHAFGCGGVGYFAWLEGEGWAAAAHNPNRFRLERFGRAMAGTGSWEAPGAVLHGFDWGALPRGSVVVDVGGGIGSTSMLLASAFAEEGLRFVIQDRAVVVEMGEKAWRDKCPELLDSGAVRFQVHDFFTPQPITDAAVFLLRVVLHDWPDAFAQRILLRLREAAAPRTRLVLADWVLPLACVDDFGVGGGGEGGEEKDGKAGKEKEPLVEGAEKMLAPAPLLANLGKASANAYWMDLTMQVTFNGQERTLRETVALAASAGWKVVRVTKAPGSLFGHIVAEPVPVPVPPQRRARAGSGSAFFDVPSAGAGAGVGGAEGGAMEMEMQREREMEMGMVERASSRCGTPTFGSRVDLPSVAEARARFGGVARRPFGAGLRAPLPVPGPLKQAAVLTAPPARKKKPSPLSVIPPPSSPSPSLYHRPITSPRPQQVPQQQQQGSSPIARRMSQAPLFRAQAQPVVPVPAVRQAPPPSPMSPPHPLSRRSSYAHLTQGPAPSPHPHHSPTTHTHALRHVPSSPVLKPPRHRQGHAHQTPSPPSPALMSRAPTPQRGLRHAPSSPVLKQHQERDRERHPLQLHPSPPSPVPTRIPALARRASHAQLQFPQTELRKRSGSIVHPAMVRAAGSGGGASGIGIGIGSSMGVGRPLMHGRVNGGGSLDFGRSRRRGDADGDSESADDEVLSGRASPVLLPGGSVLAAAARIERGIPRSPSPDP
ncbi:O-methyltransferase, partial [Mycena galericulata]